MMFLFANHFGRPLAVPASPPASPRPCSNVSLAEQGVECGLHLFHQPKLDHLLGGLDLIWMPNLNFVALSPDVKLVVTCHDLSLNYIQNFFPEASAVASVDSAPISSIAARTMSSPIRKTRSRIYFGITKFHQKKFLSFTRVLMFKPCPILGSVSASARGMLCRLPIFFTLEPWSRERMLEHHACISNPCLQASSHLHLVLAGKMGWQSKTIRLVQRVLPDARRVHVLGYVPDQDLAPLTAGAQATVFPTYYEGFGFPPSGEYGRRNPRCDKSAFISFGSWRGCSVVCRSVQCCGDRGGCGRTLDAS